MTAYVPDQNETDLKKVILALQQVAAGRSNAVGSVTLTLNSATTVVTTRTGTCFTSSVPIPIPTTANAAAEVGAGTMYISSIGVDTFTITHANSATANRTFSFVIVG